MHLDIFKQWDLKVIMELKDFLLYHNLAFLNFSKLFHTMASNEWF
jgi:hypothetical protein